MERGRVARPDEGGEKGVSVFVCRRGLAWMVGVASRTVSDKLCSSIPPAVRVERELRFVGARGERDLRCLERYYDRDRGRHTGSGSGENRGKGIGCRET